MPVSEALQEFRRRGDVVPGPPGHEQGRGADPRVVEVVGEAWSPPTSSRSTVAGGP
ncbi:hypothetical protein ACI78V_16530 [Geodermatophilus sp. SYSU D00742]